MPGAISPESGLGYDGEPIENYKVIGGIILTLLIILLILTTLTITSYNP